MGPKILSIKDRGIQANQWQIDAVIQYDGEEAQTVTFVGTFYGNPGPVVVIDKTWGQQNVRYPARYGESFGPEWIRRYFGVEL